MVLSETGSDHLPVIAEEVSGVGRTLHWDGYGHGTATQVTLFGPFLSKIGAAQLRASLDDGFWPKPWA